MSKTVPVPVQRVAFESTDAQRTVWNNALTPFSQAGHGAPFALSYTLQQSGGEIFNADTCSTLWQRLGDTITPLRFEADPVGAHLEQHPELIPSLTHASLLAQTYNTRKHPIRQWALRTLTAQQDRLFGKNRADTSVSRDFVTVFVLHGGFLLANDRIFDNASPPSFMGPVPASPQRTPLHAVMDSTPSSHAQIAWMDNLALFLQAWYDRCAEHPCSPRTRDEWDDYGTWTFLPNLTS